VDSVADESRSTTAGTDDGASYLDGAGSTPVLPHAADATARALTEFGDPRGPHRVARRAAALLERTLTAAAAAIGADQDEVHAAPSGSHANALALLGTMPPGAGRILVTALEHASVAEAAAASGLQVVEVPCDRDGRIDVDRFASEVALPRTLLASVHHVSPDLGTMQPVAECARIAREAGVRFHTDACQTPVSLPVDASAMGVDLLTLSSHKAYGPAGAGLLFARRGVRVDPFLRGEVRPGRAQPVPGVAALAGMAEALTLMQGEVADLAARLWELSGRLRTALDDADAGLRVLGHPTHRAPHIVAVAVSGVDRETLLMTLEDRGVLSGESRSDVLVRAGIARAGEIVLRLGLTRNSTGDDVDRVLDVLPDISRRLRGIARRSEAPAAQEDAARR